MGGFVIDNKEFRDVKSPRQLMSYWACEGVNAMEAGAYGAASLAFAQALILSERGADQIMSQQYLTEARRKMREHYAPMGSPKRRATPG